MARRMRARVMRVSFTMCNPGFTSANPCQVQVHVCMRQVRTRLRMNQESRSQGEAWSGSARRAALQQHSVHHPSM